MRAAPSSRRLTFEDAIEIIRRRWLGESQHGLAAAFGVNPGRIAEVLSGKLHPGAADFAERGK